MRREKTRTLTDRDASDRLSEDSKRSSAPNVTKVSSEEASHEEAASAPGKNSFRPRGVKGEIKIMSTGDMEERRNWRVEEDENSKIFDEVSPNSNDSAMMMKRIMGMTATDKKDQGEISKRADLTRSLPNSNETTIVTPAKQLIVESSPNVTSSMKKRFCRPSGTESYGSRPSLTLSGPEAHPSSLAGSLVTRALFPEEGSNEVLSNAVATNVLEDIEEDKSPKSTSVVSADTQTPPSESRAAPDVTLQCTSALTDVHQSAPNDEGSPNVSASQTGSKVSSPSLTHHKGKKGKDVRKSR